jgi:hypothetical protein
MRDPGAGMPPHLANVLRMGWESAQEVNPWLRKDAPKAPTMLNLTFGNANKSNSMGDIAEGDCTYLAGGTSPRDLLQSLSQQGALTPELLQQIMQLIGQQNGTQQQINPQESSWLGKIFGAFGGDVPADNWVTRGEQEFQNGRKRARPDGGFSDNQNTKRPFSG